jgi:oxygen-independent coproporphyrinogen-3 oxidase
MAGIYIHIPYCKQKCNYCDFHFSTNTASVQQMTDAICIELELKKLYLNNETIKTIYFGGGTPSFIPNADFLKIVNKIKNSYKIDFDVEFSIECNPDDLTDDKLNFYKGIGVNRLSVGIQSFDENQLVFMNRAHTANEAENCIKLAQKKGFNNITIDLIYGLPNSDESYWQKQIDKALTLNVNHISAYCLTIEPKTVFGNWFKKGTLQSADDDKSNAEFNLLIDSLKNNGFEQYEISNFAKDGYISKHNSAYWLGEKYIGIGPSAHSYNGHSRQWNVANNFKYIKALTTNTGYFEVENLDINNIFNEYILTRLRTKWGINLDELHNISPQHLKSIHEVLNGFIKAGDLKKNNQIITLTKKGKFLADFITGELFV